MNRDPHDVSVYLLIDNGLLQEVAASYTEDDSTTRPTWLMPIYTERALAVSPLLIDLEAAYEAGYIDQVMGYVNAQAPALHVSIIETAMSLEQAAQHLRRFILILDPDGKQFTLRYADCTVLGHLATLLSAVQWANMKGQIIRWGIHDRSGKILYLPHPMVSADRVTPLHLNREQIEALDEVSEPDHYIAKVKMMQHGAPLPGNAAQHHQWAQAAREAWRASGNSNQMFLLFLTEAALASRGEVLLMNEIHGFLLMDEVSAFRDKLRELTHEHLYQPI